MASSALRKVHDARVTKSPTAFKKRRHGGDGGADERMSEAVKDMLEESEDMGADSPARGRDLAPQNPPTNPPRLVESVNDLPIDQFITHYVPATLHNLVLPVPTTYIPGTTPSTAEAEYDHYALEIYSSTSISKSDLDACFALVKLTSSETYKHSTTGWSPAKKKNEMKLLDMRYMLLVRQDSGEEAGQDGGREIGGFLSFMVTYEDGIEVIYCYEIHLAPPLQHRGIGKILIGGYEDIGRKVGVKKCMLTVFKANVSGMRFYERLGYREDEFSPRPMKLRNGNTREFDYMILSKDLTGTESERQENRRYVVW
ncbi:hypothetical protein FQN55_006747 [Onygenales sp. PD_40]|nr:hypothetical protein FQN55_006747 [Onygenales sp. PD_40]KAK2782881.1 hypothetical protein FQN53_009567 [Emmonsiellopsis sp. PD_33]KAK2792363.1 hypothetical protein FQN51_001703 [Onygenales sp. PD_10]KAK2795785.1 hypothetical protein FQN52_003635 [Onygenales sp. PD_12]